MSKSGTGKKRVAIVISNLEFGGAQQQVVALANNIDPERCELHLISMADFVPLAGQLTAADDRFHIVAKRWKFDITVPFRLATLLRSLDVDIVHGFLFDAEIASRLAARIAGIPVCIGSERNCDYRRSRLQLTSYRLTRSLQSLCVANTHAGAAFNSRLLGYPPSHYAVVHNGVNTERFKPSDGTAVRQQHGIHADQVLVGVFGSFKAQKNHKLFFRAAARLAAMFPQLRFMLVGDQLHAGIRGSDQYKAEVNELVDELGIRELCVFAGNQERVEDYYSACDLTVLPSNHEGMPNVVLESLACGVPVVATDVSDNRLLVPEGEVGFLVDKGDLEALTERIATLVRDRERRQQMAARAVTFIEENFSARRMAEKMAEVYSTRS